MLPVKAHKGLLINEDYLEMLRQNRLDDLKRIADFQGGRAIKKNKFRSVVTVDLEEKGKVRTFYLKRHFWPWRERIKSLIPGLRKEDAKNEWKNLIMLRELGFHTAPAVAYGEKRRFGLPCFSVTMTENLDGAEKLERFLPRHFGPAAASGNLHEKRQLIERIALLAKTLHGHGLNHQDFYLGHIFFRPEDRTLFLLDLQRMHRRATVSSHDRVKDLAQLCYSAGRTGVFTKADLLRFAHAYLGKDRFGRDDMRLFAAVKAKTARIARHDRKLQKKRQPSL